jgi:hypothetical protein
MYRTLMSVRKHPLADHSIITIVWSFLVIFVGSLSAGVGVALICALISFTHMKLLDKPGGYLKPLGKS